MRFASWGPVSQKASNSSIVRPTFVSGSPESKAEKNKASQSLQPGSTLWLRIAAERNETVTRQDSTGNSFPSRRDVLIGGAAMVAAAALPPAVAASASLWLRHPPALTKENIA